MGADETVSGTWSLQAGSWEGSGGSEDTCVRMRQKLKGCLGLQLDSQLPTSLQVYEAGDPQDKLVTLSHGEEGTWPQSQRDWHRKSGGTWRSSHQPEEPPDLQWHEWHLHPMPVASFEHKKNMAASFLPSESQTKFLFWPKPLVHGAEFWEM